MKFTSDDLISGSGHIMKMHNGKCFKLTQDGKVRVVRLEACSSCAKINETWIKPIIKSGTALRIFVPALMKYPNMATQFTEARWIKLSKVLKFVTKK